MAKSGQEQINWRINSSNSVGESAIYSLHPSYEADEVLYRHRQNFMDEVLLDEA